MLNIRLEQKKALDNASLGALAERIFAILRPVSSLSSCSDEKLNQRINAAIVSARQRDIQSNRALAQYAIMAICIGPKFDQLEPVQNLFRLPGITVDTKLCLLSDWLIANDSPKKEM